MKSNLYCMCIIFVLFVVAISCSVLYSYCTADIINITVTDKERVVTTNGESVTSKYLVFTETETFENTDSLAYFKWDSSDVQGQLKVGKTYRVKVYGWRIPFLSVYRNIVSIKQELAYE